MLTNHLASSLDRYISKVSRRNQPLDYWRTKSEYRKFKSLVKSLLVSQINHISARLSKETFLPAHADNWLLANFLNLSNIVDTKDLEDYFSKVFVFAVKTSYLQNGVVAKSESPQVEFSLTNQFYIDQINNQADYLINQSSIDDTTRSQLFDIISGGLNDGLTPYEVASLISDQVDGISEKRATTIAITETANSMGMAQMAWMRENGVAEKEWVTAGNNPCRICDMNEAESPIPIDSYFSSGDDTVPAHPNCILPDQLVNAVAVSAKLTSEYDGPAIRLLFASGKTLSVTPNHLVATRSGWITASGINHGDYVLSTGSLIKEAASTIDPNIQPIESLIQNISVSGSMVFGSVPASSINFNGDESFCQDVDIVFANSELLDSAYTKTVQSGTESSLIGRDVRKFVLDSNRTTHEATIRHLSSSSGNIGSQSDSFLLGSSHSGIHKDSSSRIISDDDSMFFEMFSHRHTGDTSFWREFLDRFSSFITFDKVIDIKRFDFHGEVYDLTVPYNFYTTNSIITHNCECYVNSVSMDISSIPIEDLWSGD